MDNFKRTLIIVIVSVIILVTGVFGVVTVKDEFFIKEEETAPTTSNTEYQEEEPGEIHFENPVESTLPTEITQSETETFTESQTATETTEPINTTIYFVENTTIIDGKEAIIVEIPTTATTIPTTVVTTPTVTVTNPPATAAQATNPPTVIATDANGKININTADKDTLMTLTGIGDVKSQAIIDYRNENGAFKSIEEITNVSGIGEKTLEKIKDKITV